MTLNGTCKDVPMLFHASGISDISVIYFGTLTTETSRDLSSLSLLFKQHSHSVYTQPEAHLKLIVK